MRELSVAEQRYRAVLAVISEGRTVTDVAGESRVSRQTLASGRPAAARLPLLEVSGGGLQLTIHCPNVIADAVLLTAERRQVNGNTVVRVEQPAPLGFGTCQLAREKLAL